jgi:tRNA (adenine57-N1/adenine58-N1)-methyltransferase
MLDLPEPWLAVPHAAHVLKPGGRIASYSPCVEQAQRCIAVLKEKGFHSIRTLEFRLREHYVDEVELWAPPKDKRPRLEMNSMHHLAYAKQDAKVEKGAEAKEPEDNSGTKQDEAATQVDSKKRKAMICARPFNTMKGHSAFLTFATAGNKLQPDPTLNCVETSIAAGGDSKSAGEL